MKSSGEDVENRLRKVGFLGGDAHQKIPGDDEHLEKISRSNKQDGEPVCCGRCGECGK